MSGDEYIRTLAVKTAQKAREKNRVQRNVTASRLRTQCLEFGIEKYAPLTAPPTSDQAQDDIGITELRASPEVNTTTEMIGDCMMNLRTKNAPNEDLSTSIAEMRVTAGSTACYMVAP